MAESLSLESVVCRRPFMGGNRWALEEQAKGVGLGEADAEKGIVKAPDSRSLRVGERVERRGQRKQDKWLQWVHWNLGGRLG